MFLVLIDRLAIVIVDGWVAASGTLL